MSPSLRLFKRQRRARHPGAGVHSFTHGGGFYRNFFATLKSGAGRTGGSLERLFITGVSPVTMDDVTSGFNIGTNISLEPDFNEMVGFTELEVRHLVETYRERMPRLAIPNQTVKRLMTGICATPTATCGCSRSTCSGSSSC